MCYTSPAMREAMAKAVRIGVASVRANAVPMAALWLLAIALAGAYFRLPAFAGLLEHVRLWQVANPRLAPFLNRMLFCGLIPGAFLCLVPSLRPKHVLAVIALESVWNGLLGVASDMNFRVMSAVFGNGTDLATLVKKTLVDQLAWTVLFIAPANAVFHFWVARGFSFRRTLREWPPHFYGQLVAPNLVSNWCVWTPVQFSLFMFPLDLQIHTGGLVCTFWTLMCLQIGRRTR